MGGRYGGNYRVGGRPGYRPEASGYAPTPSVGRPLSFPSIGSGPGAFMPGPASGSAAPVLEMTRGAGGIFELAFAPAGNVVPFYGMTQAMAESLAARAGLTAAMRLAGSLGIAIGAFQLAQYLTSLLTPGGGARLARPWHAGFSQFCSVDTGGEFAGYFEPFGTCGSVAAIAGCTPVTATSPSYSGMTIVNNSEVFYTRESGYVRDPGSAADPRPLFWPATFFPFPHVTPAQNGETPEKMAQALASLAAGVAAGAAVANAVLPVQRVAAAAATAVELRPETETPVRIPAPILTLRAHRQKKPPPVSAVWKMIGTTTELLDVVDCAWNALPKQPKRIRGLRPDQQIAASRVHGTPDCRSPPKRPRWYDPNFNGGKGGWRTKQLKDKKGRPITKPPMGQRIMDVAFCFNDIDMRAFHDCILEETLKDMSIGKLAGPAAREGSARMGTRPLGATLTRAGAAF